MAVKYNLCLAFVLLTLGNDFINSQVVNNVRLVNHAEYMLNVIRQTVEVVEERLWCNLKLPDTNADINEVIIDWAANGTAAYTNGFLVSIQHMDIMESTLQQVWNRTHPGLVDVQGRLRLHNVVVGSDVIVKLTIGDFRYTATYTHPLVTFDFSVVKDLNLDTLTASVTGATPNSVNTPRFLPRDNISDVLATLYVRTSTVAGINAWGPDVFAPIAQDLVDNKIQFPTICYNCPV